MKEPRFKEVCRTYYPIQFPRIALSIIPGVVCIELLSKKYKFSLQYSGVLLQFSALKSDLFDKWYRKVSYKKMMWFLSHIIHNLFQMGKRIKLLKENRRKIGERLQGFGGKKNFFTMSQKLIFNKYVNYQKDKKGCCIIW